MSIIWTANTKRLLSHTPISHDRATRKTRSIIPSDSNSPNRKAKNQVSTVRITAIVNGAGRKDLNAFMNFSENDK
jgi:hypothetical protein